MSKKHPTLKECMTPSQRAELGDKPTWHSTCMDLFGVARPGKTERDRRKKQRSDN